jgi:putative membrane protein
MGIVIGLLLVFRTNTAYDRWWEARKIFSSLHSTFLYIYQKSRYTEKRTEILYSLKRININIFGFVSTNSEKESESYKKSFLKHHINLSEMLSGEELSSSVMSTLERKYSDILDQFSSLERIKSTPIPLSYTLHIKLSIMFYLISLPFGLFFELGVWATPFIMILFFIIGGIEIISNEIENPFSDSPNDLPINDYKKENEKYLNV